MDRFLREFAAVEDESNRGPEVENVAVTTYKAADGQSPAAVLPKVFRTEPNVVVVRDLPDAETVALICRERGRVGPLVHRDASGRRTAPRRCCGCLMLKAPPEEVAAGRLRRVVPAAGAETVRHAARSPMPPRPRSSSNWAFPRGACGRFIAPTSPSPTKARKTSAASAAASATRAKRPSSSCSWLDDTVREVLAATPKLDLLRQAARKAGMKSLQEEGILLVARGVTSLPELMRVMKQ